MDASSYTYGSDLSGLVWGYRFAGRAHALDAASAASWLEGPAKEGEFIWLHFNLSNAASEKWMKGHLALAQEFFEALHRGSRSTRIEVADDTLIGVVNDLRHDFSFDSADFSTLWMSVSSRVVVSARRAPLQSIERLRQAVNQGAAIDSTLGLLVHLLQDQADVLVRVVREAVERVDSIEDNLLAGRLSHKREDLGTMRRVLVHLQRLLAPEPSSLFRLLQRPPAWIGEHDRQELRQSTEEFAVVLSDMGALQERIKLLQEEIAARVDEATGRSLFLLTVVTVMALPINLIAGLLGMNVGGVPLAQDPNGFWLVVGAVVGITAAAGLVLARMQRSR